MTTYGSYVIHVIYLIHVSVMTDVCLRCVFEVCSRSVLGLALVGLGLFVRVVLPLVVVVVGLEQLLVAC